ncbi:MAG TPA: trypsin-like serine protease, partial [Polyangia bacterium]
MRRLESLFVAATLTLLAPGCESPAGPVSEARLPIVGGTLATTCVWPTAVMVEGPAGCSATLVHPHIVVTAKHCLLSEQGKALTPTLAGLGESSMNWARTVQISRCYTHPDNDFGFCTLVDDVANVPIVPLMAPCETSELGPGKAIVEVGFGVTTPTARTDGLKKWINGTIESISADLVNINVTTGSQDGEYFGDSGGPLFFQMPDHSWRLIGEDCCSDSIVPGTAPRISTYTSVPLHVPWMEQQLAMDLTPCHDANGWNPTAACTGVPTNPGSGVGGWASMCSGENLVREPTCVGMGTDAGIGGRDTGQGGNQDGRQDAGQDASNDGFFDVDSGDADSGDSGMAKDAVIEARPDGFLDGAIAVGGLDTGVVMVVPDASAGFEVEDAAAPDRGNDEPDAGVSVDLGGGARDAASDKGSEACADCRDGDTGHNAEADSASPDHSVGDA